jgi:hypothetical protein
LSACAWKPRSCWMRAVLRCEWRLGPASGHLTGGGVTIGARSPARVAASVRRSGRGGRAGARFAALGRGSASVIRLRRWTMSSAR